MKAEFRPDDDDDDLDLPKEEMDLWKETLSHLRREKLAGEHVSESLWTKCSSEICEKMYISESNLWKCFGSAKYKY